MLFRSASLVPVVGTVAVVADAIAVTCSIGLVTVTPADDVAADVPAE